MKKKKERGYYKKEVRRRPGEGDPITILTYSLTEVESREAFFLFKSRNWHGSVQARQELEDNISMGRGDFHWLHRGIRLITWYFVGMQMFRFHQVVLVCATRTQIWWIMLITIDIYLRIALQEAVAQKN
ncbi:hypothetical protein VNO77_03528 [Canavalia gladiata]|uniref:Uncharacterized protein n=1 Tax=Canavalia gladiata TaxID=3824 RepID=A0AAN9N009_CANGL